eukprot:GFYU01002389.1.p1 GENE.GFYU01002389.1~~GFYU01002389.1.p1  ORF type:complete len:374 (+),score=89.40 GFYU01002389.1:243-1364(+)
MPLADRKGLNMVSVKVPEPADRKDFSLTSSGNYREEELALNSDGIRFKKTSPAPSSPDGTKKNEDAEDVQYDIALKDLKTLKVIGQGSSGIVKKVVHVPRDEVMALKVIPLDVNDIVRKQILNELRTLHASNCEYIVTFNGAFYQEGTVSIALEYMDGGTLTQIISAMGSLPENVLAKIASMILQGLAYLHKERHLIHRDVKPSNLLLNRKGKIKISDFGVSGQLANSVSKCVSWVGTVTYMSPERILGKQYGYNSDCWSLGLTILEGALGKFPYPPPGEPVRLGFWDLLDYIVEKPPPTLSEDEWSPEFCDFMAKCLQKTPEDRWGSAQLLEHPFIKKYENDGFDLSEWIKETLVKMEQMGKGPEDFDENTM